MTALTSRAFYLGEELDLFEALGLLFYILDREDGQTRTASWTFV